MWNDIDNITKAGISKIEMAKSDSFQFFMRSFMAGAYLAIAAILSFFIPGLGQMYAGDMKRGLIFLVVWIVLMIVAFFTAFLTSIITLIFDIYAAYDAYKLAQ